MKVRLVHADDWTGLYINDDLCLENHNIELCDCMKILQRIAPESTLAEIDYDDTWADLDWLEEQGHYPDKYQDVVGR